jgi:hypothetical protein
MQGLKSDTSFVEVVMSDAPNTMVERLLDEGKKLGMSEAGAFIAERTGGTPIHATTVTRWCLKGARLPSGLRIRLEHFRCGPRLFTTREAIVRFIKAQTEPTGEPINPRTPTERNRATDQAEKELDILGV